MRTIKSIYMGQIIKTKDGKYRVINVYPFFARVKNLEKQTGYDKDTIHIGELVQNGYEPRNPYPTLYE